MAGVRAEMLLATTHFIKRFTLDRAWVGLTDEELRWEPVPGAWGVRPRAECRTPDSFDTADPDVVAEYDHARAMAADWQTTIEPMTTIGWLLWHVGSQPGRLADLDFLGGSETAVSGWTSPYLSPHPAFTSGEEAVEHMRSGWRALIGRLREAGDGDLARPTDVWTYGEARPPASGAQIVASILHEVAHHGSQICTLRDLYVATGARGGPPPDE